MKQVAIISPLERSFPLDLSSWKWLSPRYGSVSIASYLAHNGYKVRVFCEHSHNPIDWDFVARSDYVAFSLLSFCAYRGYELIKRVRSLTRAQVIIGGNHASVQPEESAMHADYVVRNEGEATMLALLRALDSGEDASDLPGISYRRADGFIVHNPNREFMEDLDVIADFSLVQGYGPMTIRRRLADVFRNVVPHVNLPFVMASRGCPYKCKFCFTRRELGNSLRLRSAERVVEEIENVAALTRTRVIWFSDADLLLNREYAIELLTRIAQTRPRGVDFIAFCRATVADDPEVQGLLKAAAVHTLCVGAESTNANTLVQFGKAIDPAELKDQIKRLRASGFRVFTSFIFGGDDDTPKTINDAVDWALDAGVDGTGFHPLYDFPNQEVLPNGEQALPDGRFIHHDWRLFNGNFVIFFPKRMRPSTLQRGVRDAYMRFYRHHKTSIHDYRPVFLTYDRYIPYLESVEKGMYNGSDELIEERLAGLDPASIKLVPADFSGISTTGYAISVMLRNLVRPVSWKLLLKYGSAHLTPPTRMS